MESGRENAGEKNRGHAADDGDEFIDTENNEHQVVDDPSEKGGDGVDSFGEDKGNFADENIPKDAAAAAGGHAEKKNEKGVVAVAHGQTGLDADDGKGAQTHSVEKVIDVVDVFSFVEKNRLVSAGEKKSGDGE